MSKKNICVICKKDIDEGGDCDVIRVRLEIDGDDVIVCSDCYFEYSDKVFYKKLLKGVKKKR